MARYNTEFYEPVVHDYANFGTWTDRGSIDASTRATAVWTKILEDDVRPIVDPNKVADLQAFITRRTNEGGALPES
jgi:trimethylamine--corrinoid protein Co-methyltransferase